MESEDEEIIMLCFEPPPQKKTEKSKNKKYVHVGAPYISEMQTAWRIPQPLRNVFEWH